MKRILTGILTVVMLLGICAASFAAGTSFSDVPAGADYADAVAWCVENKLMNGVGGGRFDPSAALDRRTLATVLYRAEGEPAVSAASRFSDVPDGQWYTNGAIWADQQKLITGYGGGVFGAADPVTRVQLDIIFQRYQGGNPAWPGDPTKASATRAEVAVALMTYLKDKMEAPAAQTPETTEIPEAPAPAETTAEGKKVLVAVFSATGNTKGVAEKIASAAGADLYEITPAQPYTSADLNYNSDCRANREQNDDSARPELAGTVENWADYDVIYLGYPIWWGKAPKIIHTFLETYDCSGKTVIPFCTSGSSPYNDGGIKELAGSANWITGRRFAGGASESEVKSWVDSLDLG